MSETKPQPDEGDEDVVAVEIDNDDLLRQLLSGRHMAVRSLSSAELRTFRHRVERPALWEKMGEWDSDLEALEAFNVLRRIEPDGYPDPIQAQEGKKPTERSLRSVCLVGKAYGHMFVPWEEVGWEVWGLNLEPVPLKDGPGLDRYHRWFQLHPPHYLKVHYPEGVDELAKVWGKEVLGPKGKPVRMYMDKAYERYPNSEAFPKQAIEALTPRGAYHCSSMDWMLALAVHEGFERIRCAGFNFTTFPITNGEPLSSRPCFEYWCGVADGRGVQLEVVGPTGHMFKTTHLALRSSTLQYGFEHEPALDLAKGESTAQGAAELENGEWEDVR